MFATSAEMSQRSGFVRCWRLCWMHVQGIQTFGAHKKCIHVLINKSKVSSHQSHYFCVHKLSPLTDASLNLAGVWQMKLLSWRFWRLHCVTFLSFGVFFFRESCDFMDPWFLWQPHVKTIAQRKLNLWFDPAAMCCFSKTSNNFFRGNVLAGA